MGCSRPEDNVVNVYDWADYASPELIRGFEASTGIRVNHDVFDSNLILETKLLTGNSGYDVVVPGHGYLERLIGARVFAPLDRSLLSNLASIDADVMARLARHDPGNRHGIAYVWGTSGLAYDVVRLRARMPDAPLDSWSLLFDPKVVARFADCGVGMPDSPVAMLPAVLAWLGLDPLSENAADLARAEAALVAMRPYVRKLDNAGLKEDLANGDLCLVATEGGSLAQARRIALEANRNVALEYSLPREGAMLWIDVLAIPADAPHPRNAHRFINYIMDAAVAAAMTNDLKFASANAAALPKIDPALRDDPAIYPPPEVRQRLFTDVARGDEFARQRNRLWTRFKTAR